MKGKKRIDRTTALATSMALLLCVSLGVNAAQAARSEQIRRQLEMEQKREMTDVVAAMADIEVNLQKLLLASGAVQSVDLLGETALLAQHVETGLARLPLSAEASSGAMKFAGQVGEYAMALAVQVSGGGMLSAGDERQLESMLSACQGLNAHLLSVGERIYSEPATQPDLYGGGMQGWPNEALAGAGGIEYPSLIYDGPFSDGRTDAAPRGLTGERVAREQAREAAAQYAGTTADRVSDAADSGGPFEAFGFTAETADGRISVQVTGQGGHLLWMMPEQAEFEMKYGRDECLNNAQVWLGDAGFGAMQRCFVQTYDGMVVANFVAVQDGVLLYPDQVKVQVSMATGAIVGAECSQYLMNHVPRDIPEPAVSIEQARNRLSDRLQVQDVRLCVIPAHDGERLCWEFRGMFGSDAYYAYVDASTGEAREILRVQITDEGETAV